MSLGHTPTSRPGVRVLGSDTFISQKKGGDCFGIKTKAFYHLTYVSGYRLKDICEIASSTKNNTSIREKQSVVQSGIRRGPSPLAAR